MKLVLIILITLAVAVVVQGQSNISLLDNSPFMPPGTVNGGKADEDSGPASLARLQLRGITSIDGQYIFSVYNPDTRESKWIPEGKSEDGLLIKSYDPAGNSIVIHSESENLSRQMEMNDYAAPVALRATPQRMPIATPQPKQPTPQATTPTGTLSRTQQSVQRPTRRNLETLRARREELAEKLRKQPKPGSSDQGSGQNQGQPNGGKR